MVQYRKYKFYDFVLAMIACYEGVDHGCGSGYLGWMDPDLRKKKTIFEGSYPKST